MASKSLIQRRRITNGVTAFRLKVDNHPPRRRFMAEDPVSLHPANMARQLMAEGAPEGVLLANAWKRVGAYILDVIFIMGILMITTSGTFILWTYSISGITEAPHIVLLHWMVLFASHWLYFKYTGLWMGRSLGQRWFHIALVHGDATPLGRIHWGRRAVSKTKYAIPLIGQFWFGLRDLVKIKNDESHRSRVDFTHHTVAAVDWSLPPATRAMLR